MNNTVLEVALIIRYILFFSMILGVILMGIASILFSYVKLNFKNNSLIDTYSESELENELMERNETQLIETFNNFKKLNNIGKKLIIYSLILLIIGGILTGMLARALR